MGRQNGDPTMVSSSIALLQERFRQLQRVKEKREEKELLKLFSEPERMAPTARYDPNRLSLQPEKITHKPALQDSISLGLNSQSSRPDYRGKMIPSSSSLWPNSAGTPRNIDNSDVDTSLHL